MVFYHTNFSYETTIWFTRRFRPVFFPSLALVGSYFLYKYYFFGKNAALTRRYLMTEQQQRQWAQDNKRSFSLDNHYSPTLEISTKKRIKELMGSEWKPAYPWEEYVYQRDFRDIPPKLSEFEELQQLYDENLAEQEALVQA